jgi:ATP-dependent Lon protease
VQRDEIDGLAAEAFENFVVRKDLALRFKGQYPVPTYVGEFLLARYCAGTDETEIAEGLEVVERLMSERTVRAGEEELFKARARERGRVKIIDLITVRLDPKTDAYLATLPSLQLKDCRIEWGLIDPNQRMLTGGFYAEVDLEYDAMLAEQKNGRPFGVVGVKPIQMSTRDAVERLAEGRSRFTTEQWKWLLLRSAGLEPSALTERERDILLLRMVPFVVRNYNAVELGPRGTGKSHLFQQVSPYAHLISGGKATVAQMFVNNASGQRGLVCQYDVVCFDEIGGVSFDQKDGVQIMKGYMESGQFSRGKESIRGDGGLVFVGNFDVDVHDQLRRSHLFGPLPKEMRDDTAFMDRLHAYIPGWDVPKMHAELFTGHFALVSDFIAECWNKLRTHSLMHLWGPRVELGPALSGRDTTAVNKTIDGLLKLLYPGAEQSPPDEDIEWAARLALESRRRVKEQQKRIGAKEFGNTDFGFEMASGGGERHVGTPETAADGEETGGSEPRVPGPSGTAAPAVGSDGSTTSKGQAEGSPALARRPTSELMQSGESQTVEYKASARWSLEKGDRDTSIEAAIVRAIVSMMNADGGTLLIGVNDSGEAVGLDNDLKLCKGKSLDGFQLWLTDRLELTIGKVFLAFARVSVEDVDGHSVCRIDVTPSSDPVWVKDGALDRFYVRFNNTTRELRASEADDYIQRRRRAAGAGALGRS